ARHFAGSRRQFPVKNRFWQTAPIPDKGFSPTDRRRMTVTLPQSKLDALVTRLKTVETDLAAGPDRDTYVKLSREFSELQPLVATIRSYQGVESEIADLDAMLADGTTDRDMRALAEAEKPALEQRREQLAQEIRLALIPKDAMDERNVI